MAMIPSTHQDKTPDTHKLERELEICEQINFFRKHQKEAALLLVKNIDSDFAYYNMHVSNGLTQRIPNTYIGTSVVKENIAFIQKMEEEVVSLTKLLQKKIEKRSNLPLVLTEKDRLIQEIQDMFKQFGHLNYWGAVHHGEQLACLGCLSCGKCKYDFKYFERYGPDLGRNVYFCNDCTKIWSDKIIDLQKQPGYTRDDYDKAMQKIKNYEDDIRKTSKTELEKAKHLEWYFFG